jgi:hypothetical protein
MSEKINPNIELSLIERSEAFANPQLLNLIFLSLYLTYQPIGPRMPDDIAKVRDPFEPKSIAELAIYSMQKEYFSVPTGESIYTIADKWTPEFDIPIIYINLLNHIEIHLSAVFLVNPHEILPQIHEAFKDFLMIIDATKSNRFIMQELDVPLSLIINHFYKYFDNNNYNFYTIDISFFLKYISFLKAFCENIDGYETLKKTLSKYPSSKDFSKYYNGRYSNGLFPTQFIDKANKLDDFMKLPSFLDRFMTELSALKNLRTLLPKYKN